MILDGRVGLGSTYYEPGYDKLKAGGLNVVWSNPPYVATTDPSRAES